ncbi:hypothetical protein KCP78_18525 [Salmonella enterica subsp. enterica]|nr:hypothetical protein KCP78_18525 [Salmonella enterica subsp. enterica]
MMLTEYAADIKTAVALHPPASLAVYRREWMAKKRQNPAAAILPKRKNMRTRNAFLCWRRRRNRLLVKAF